MRVFFGTSTFVKRYVSEPGTDAVLDWCDQATEIGLSGIALPEIISAFCRLRREDKITDTQYRQLKSLLLADIEACTELTEILPKFAAQQYVPDAAAVTLAQAREWLATRTVRGLQLRYRYDGADWWDTLMQDGDRYRIVRIRHDFAG